MMIIYLNILFPVYNEQKRLKNGIEKTIDYMEGYMPGKYVLTIVDNASVDGTQSIAIALTQKYSQVKYIRTENKGVGIAFREGISKNTAEIVGYMDVDLSTDIRHIKDMMECFKNDNELCMVNASRWSKESDTKGRKWYRILTSNGLTIMLKLFVGLKASDSICGFKFFRKEVAENLIKEAGTDENGWFYIIEVLLRAEKANLKIFELPVRWQDDYNSTVNVLSLIINYCQQMVKLRKKFKKEGIKI